MKIAFLLYPTSQVKVHEDTSFWIMHELSRRGHEVFHFEASDMAWENGSSRARLTRSLTSASKGFLASKAPQWADLASLDAVFVRKEPPVDAGYLHALQLLEAVKDRVFVVNDPAGVAMANEKLLILSFPKFIPETLVTQDADAAARFVKKNRKAVIKALDGKGGAGVFMTAAADRNLPSLLEAATETGERAVMLQRFVDGDKHGDKRLLVLDGEILGALLRRPSRADFRANLGVGATLHRAAVTREDRAMVAAMTPFLRKHGLWFTGLDVIGGKLTEINVTSPSGIADLNVLEKSHLERRVADWLEKRV